ncbi:DUF4352 domain-containing protein [Micromonospora kangleipakensis]|nr:DUF4352 domain-containing protein [Micromonospora kangleipakensis]
MPPVSGAPYPPTTPQPPVSGTPYPPPSMSGGGYPPPVSGGGYSPSGPYPPAPGQPFGAPPPAAPRSRKKVWLTIGIAAAVLLLLCCGGGIFAIYAGAKKVEKATESLPTPAVTNAPVDEPSSGAADPTPDADRTTGETFNMEPGDTLVIDDEDGTIQLTVDNFRTSAKACKTYMPGPEEGMYVIADVTAEVTKGTGSFNPFFFRWVGADGTEASGMGGALSGCGKLLPSGNDLPAGSKRTGQLIFDVKDKNGTVEYEHRLKTAGSWKP